MMTSVGFTKEMIDAAQAESEKREHHIKHHFEVAHFSSDERNQIGFLGEFCFCQLMGEDWRQNIRDNYLTIDDCDFRLNNLVIDVKTETVPKRHAHKIIQRTIDDDAIYGRRLYSEGQFNLLKKYDVVVFGLTIREENNAWYPIGFIFARDIQTRYTPTRFRPDGGRYPSPGAPIRTSELRPIEALKQLTSAEFQ
ncbi:hypothetical protein [Vibrio alfacsensis]|uniref:hypothetical protein n=1 Tax=Vibrio alfacsensis TaxID=1074311 RepID=UPI001BEE32BC|nr:hypothetical protein [Vibrio alfacsensis]BCN23383.1 hypothetical protein VYA_05750 [Vibrio alfacsensis]